MNYAVITSSEGYRVEDLKKKDRRVMKEIYDLIEYLSEATVSDVECSPLLVDEEMSTLEKIQHEIKQEYHQEVVDYLTMRAMELQIYFAEKDEYKD